MKKTLRHGKLIVQLDKSQVFPDDPGQGTPAIVRSFQYSATYWCAADTGYLTDEKGNELRLTTAECRWLEEIDREITDFLYKEGEA